LSSFASLGYSSPGQALRLGLDFEKNDMRENVGLA